VPIVLPPAGGLPDLTLNIDTSGTPFGDAPTWTDYSGSLLLAGEGRPVSITWGRQDESSEPQPRTCSFLLDNTDATFTPTGASAPAGWDVGSRVRVSLVLASTTYDRFDGYVDSILPTWPGGVESWNVVEVSCTDVTARLKIGQPLRSMLDEEMLGDSPLFFYPLDEPAGSTAAGDLSGNQNSAAVRVDSKYGTASFAFGAESTLHGAPTGLALAPSTPSPYGSWNSFLAVARNATTGPYPTTAGGFTMECWAMAPTTLPTQSSNLVTIDAGNRGSSITMFNFDSTGAPAFWVEGQNGVGVSPGIFTSMNDGLWHHYAGVLDTDQRTARFYIDGVQVASSVAASAMTFGDLVNITIGGGMTIQGDPQGAWLGSIAKVAVYDTALSPARVADRYKWGFGTVTESSGLRYARVAEYAGLTPTALPTGQAVIAAQDTNGQSVTDVLATIARTEGTVSYVTGDGSVTFQDRATRYTPASTLALTCDDIEGDVAFRRDRQGFANEYTVTRAGGTAQRVTDTASRARYGRFDGGSLDVVSSTDDDALQLAAWLVALRKDPHTRTPSLNVDLLAQTDATKVQAILTADISTLITVTDLPSQAPASSVSLFLEGGQEHIGPQDWDIGFFTSPNLPFTTLRADGTASSRTKLDSGLKVPL
jgi:hypothetical protein